MKHAVFSFVFAVTLCSVQAQVWCPPGATWWYDYDHIAGGTGYAQVTYVADTVISGVSAQKLTAHVSGYDQAFNQPIEQELDPLYTALIGEVVSLWTGSEFDTLFRYQAVPGDHWLPAGNASPGTMYTVLDTGSRAIDGTELHWWAMDLGPNMNVTTDTIYERMGGLRVFLRPEVILGVTDPEIWDLRCYEDESLSYTSGTAPACDFVTALPDGALEIGMAILPNPATDRFTLSAPAGSSYVVRDLTGRLVAEGRMVGPRAVIHAEHWPTGVYFASVRTGMGEVVVRMVKH